MNNMKRANIEFRVMSMSPRRGLVMVGFGFPGLTPWAIVYRLSSRLGTRIWDHREVYAGC